MHNYFSVGDRAKVNLIGKTVSTHRLCAYMDRTVAILLAVRLPLPTFSGAMLVYFFPKAFLHRALWFTAVCMWFAATVMPMHKAKGLVFDPAATLIGVGRKWCGLSATAHAKAIKIGAIPKQPPLYVMPSQVADRFALAVSSALVIVLGDFRLFAASALAIAIGRGQSVIGNPQRIFCYVVGKGWGMIVHSDSLLKIAVAQSLGRFAVVARHFVLGCCRSNCSTFCRNVKAAHA